MTDENINQINKMTSRVETLTTDQIFQMMELYFGRRYIMYSHMYNSFNKFIEDDIKNFLIEGDHTFFEKITKDQVIRYKFIFENITLRPPVIENTKETTTYMFPTDARNRNLTYSSQLDATVSQIQEISDIFTKELVSRKVIGVPVPNTPIANIPIMVRSKYCTTNIMKGFDNTECEYDPGCYFIVKGSEKVVISQERMIDNKPLVFKKKGPGTVAYYAQINSRSPKLNGIMQIIRVHLNNNGSLSLLVPILNEFPIMILFRALGIKSDRDIIDYIVPDKNDHDMLDMVIQAIRMATDEKGNAILDQEDAINYLTTKIRVLRKYSETDKDIRQKQKRKHLETLLANNFLPHITGGTTYKVYYLGYIINKLLNCALGRNPPDDRDSYVNKRIDLVGTLLDMLFRQFFKKMLNECNKHWKKRNSSDENPTAIINQIRPNIIEQGLTAALLTGAWGTGKIGVAQVLQRLTYLQAIEFFRRIDSPSNDASSSKLTTPRHLHPTQNGMLCPTETPEHAKVGLVKHLTLLGSITVATMTQLNIIKKLVDRRITRLSDVHPTQIMDYARVFINGDLYGACERPVTLYSELKNAKYNNSIEATVAIIYDDLMNEVRIYCDGGRLFRPVIRVIDNAPLLTSKLIDIISPNKTRSETMITSWDEFMQRNPGVIEYIDAEEQVYSMIAPTVENVSAMKTIMNKSAEMAKTNKTMTIVNRYGDMTFVKYSHCEFHPSLLLGMIVTNIPFCNHNQGPRNIFQYAQGRQAMCVYISNYRFRMDTSYILYHPQKPLVNTRTGKFMYNDILSPGENAIVAIMCYTGYNQEDSIVFNQSAIDRGLYRSTSYEKYQSILKKNQSSSQDEIFMKPDPTKVSGMRPGSYEKLNERGFIPEETIISHGDVLIGKVSPIQQIEGSNKIYKDNSETYKQQVDGVVDKVYSDIKTPDGYEMKKMKVRSERIPTVGDKYCLLKDAEVLTSDGWIPINKITMEHQVASLIDDEYLEYVKPIAVYNFKYNGEMYKLRSQQVDLDVTMDHMMYVKKRDHNKFECIPAKKIIGKRVHYKKWAINNKPDIQTFDEIEGMKLDMDTWIRFFGIWYAEGWANVYGSDVSPSSYQTTICQCKERISSILPDIATKLGFKYCVHGSGHDCNNDKFTISNKPLAKYMKPLSVGAVNKSLPAWVWNLSQRQSKMLLEHMILGDGSTNPQGSVCYYTSSDKLANDVMKLAIHSGWSGSRKLLRKAGYTTEIKGRPITMNCDALCVRIVKTKNEPQVNHGHTKSQNGQSEETYHYEGDVYCLEVQSHVFMVRQNGKNVWTGNCSRHGQKGTIGLLLPQSDMPFTEKGITPDLIINPNAIPSRMTLGHLLECLLGKVGAIKGHECDGTSFTRVDPEGIKDELEKLGYKRDGCEYLYNGMTGQKMKSMIFIGPTYYQRLKHLVKDKVHCEKTEGLEVLTYTGWKTAEQLTMDDQIATLKDGKLVYDKPLKLMHYPDYEGEMYHIKTQLIEIDVTGNHRMWVSKLVGGRGNVKWQSHDFEYARDIVGKHRKYKKDADWNAPDYQFYIPSVEDRFGKLIEKKIVEMDYWLQFFGIWIAEGCASHRTNLISICHCKERVRKVLFNILPKMGYNYYENGRKHIQLYPTGSNLSFNDKQLNSYMRLWSVGAPNKRLPDWVWQLSQRQARLLLESMVLGDGTYKKPYGGLVYTTSSKQLADDVMRLCLHCGWSGNICISTKAGNTSIIRGKTIVSKYDVLRIGINTTKNTPEVNHSHVKNQNAQEETFGIEKCPVFCLQVPSEVFYVRRNGKAVWTGNSRAKGPRTLLLHQPSEGRARGGGMRIGEMERDALISHGVSRYIKEKLMDTSDIYTTYVCDFCGLFAERIKKPDSKVYSTDKDMYTCRSCNNSTNISKIVIPYAFKLLVQELMSMCIAPRIRIENDKYTS